MITDRRVAHAQRFPDPFQKHDDCVQCGKSGHEVEPLCSFWSCELCELVVRHFEIAPNRLDIIIFFKRIDQLHQLLRLLPPDLNVARRPPREPRAFAFTKHGFEHTRNIVKTVNTGPDLVTVLIALDILSAALDGRL